MLLLSSGSPEISPSTLQSSSKVLMDSAAGFIPFLGEIPVLNFNDSCIQTVSTVLPILIYGHVSQFVYCIEAVAPTLAGFLDPVTSLV